jgi:hypothetical protein
VGALIALILLSSSPTSADPSPHDSDLISTGHRVKRSARILDTSMSAAWLLNEPEWDDRR